MFTFVVAYHALLILLLPACIAKFNAAAFWLFLITYVIGGMTITVGYHRLYAHRAYTANPVFEWAILLGSALSFEMSALKWSHDHRIHHNHCDTDKDPYSIKKGFWYAHVLWLFDFEREYDPKLVKDLEKNPRVMFQHKHYGLILLSVNFLVFLLGWYVTGSAVASFYMGFLLRLAFIHHCTWFINSLCHTFGSKTYARELTAVDNAILALLTFGEGYHNYHHAFAGDYRNGIRWYHFDPTKWTIWTASKLGLAGNLRSLNTLTLRKSLIQKDRKLIVEHLSEEVDEAASELRAKIEALAAQFDAKTLELMNKLREFKDSSSTQRNALKNEIKLLRRSLKGHWGEWVELTKATVQQYDIVHAH